jgi:hypothetical protein
LVATETSQIFPAASTTALEGDSAARASEIESNVSKRKTKGAAGRRLKCFWMMTQPGFPVAVSAMLPTVHVASNTCLDSPVAPAGPLFRDSLDVVRGPRAVICRRDFD